MSCQMKCLVFFRIIRFLKNGHIVSSTFMKISVFICVDRVNLKSDHSKILSRKLTCLTDVLHVTHTTALACKNQDFLHPGIGDDLHLMLDLLRCQAHSVDVIVAVKATVYTIVLAIIGNVEWREKINRIAKVFSRLSACFLRHLLQERFCSR